VWSSPEAAAQQRLQATARATLVGGDCAEGKHQRPRLARPTAEHRDS
jgi:hypothetical protein